MSEMTRSNQWRCGMHGCLMTENTSGQFSWWECPQCTTAALTHPTSAAALPAPFTPVPATPAPDVDDLASTVRESIYADDRQTRVELVAGLKALNTLESRLVALEEAVRAYVAVVEEIAEDPHFIADGWQERTRRSREAFRRLATLAALPDHGHTERPNAT